MSTVDVVIPCYRYAHFLPQCVGSVIDQSVRDLRVLIIDDASPDNTAEVAAALMARDSRITVLRHRTNKGHIYTYNEGIEWASSDYFLLLSADDFLCSGALERSASVLDAYPTVGFTFGRVVELNNDGHTSDLPCRVDVIADAPWRLMSGAEFISVSGAKNIVGPPTAVVRTSLQKRLGGYRQELPHSGDMEMWLRLAAHSSVGFINAVQAVYRRHSGNMSLDYAPNRLPDILQRKAAFDCFFDSCGSLLSDREAIRNRLYWLLACDTVSLASSAFNEHQITLADEVAQLALSTHPKIRWSRHWIKFMCKRLLGPAAWRGLGPAISRIRRTRPGC